MVLWVGRSRCEEEQKKKKCLEKDEDVRLKALPKLKKVGENGYGQSSKGRGRVHRERLYGQGSTQLGLNNPFRPNEN